MEAVGEMFPIFFQIVKQMVIVLDAFMLLPLFFFCSFLFLFGFFIFFLILFYIVKYT